MKTKIFTIGSALLLGASTATAQVQTVQEFPNRLIGSDTLNAVMDDLLTVLGPDLSGGITEYSGLGSSQGERQLEGSPNAGEPFCTPTDGNGAPENNPGCQEISPMSRQMGSRVCEDDSAISNAEGLAFCGDGLVIVSDNLSYGQYGDSASTCSSFAALSNTDNAGSPPSFPDRGVGNLRDTGTLPTTGYVIGGGSLTAATAWTDVPRLIYTGCANTDGLCSAASDNRVTRCGSEVRRELVSKWGQIFEGVDCGAAGDNCTTGTADGGLRFAFRRDNASGTTGVFLSLLGVSASTSSTPGTGNLLDRGSVVTFSGGVINATPMPTRNSFCDGGQIEGFFPTNYGAGAVGEAVPLFDLGDPIRRPCAPEDDLCAHDGRLGLVRPVISTDATVDGYPDFQCGSVFEYVQFINTARRVCPDGSQPFGGGCPAGFYQSGAFKTFDCLNDRVSRASTVPTTVDGRAYNYVQHAQDGTVSYVVAGVLPRVAQWRMNMAQLNTGFGAASGFAFGGAQGGFVCTEPDATRNIGCLVGQTTCTIGFSGREAAYTTANNDTLFNEPLLLRDSAPTDAEIVASTPTAGYPFARNLFINALNGFENLTADCLARGQTQDYCDDELLIATTFFESGQVGNPIADICSDAGFIPFATPTCVGSNSSASASCGKPVVQALSQCEPQ